MLDENYQVPLLPPTVELETKTVLRKTAEAHRYLAELKGIAATIPNQNILIETLCLQEARESSAIENIVSTFDDVYQSSMLSDTFTNAAAKEVHYYARALKKGFALVAEHNLLTNNHIVDIQATIEHNNAGFRRLPGTKLLNEQTGQIVYTPPQDAETIVALMQNLEVFMNDDELYDADPLVKMAVIHHQFETIHPFYDGNGRTGRIINILYLIKKDLLNLPILYMSRYIIRHKASYYSLLQHVRQTEVWEPWVLFMLDAVSVTARETIALIKSISQAMMEYKHRLRQEAPKIYSQDLLNALFRNPYTKIEYLMAELELSRNTTVRLLDTLLQLSLIEKRKIGKSNFYLNKGLMQLLVL